MKRLSIVLLLCAAFEAQAVDIQVVPNAPLFEGGDCRSYENTEAIRAILQLIASAKASLEIDTYSLESSTALKLVRDKTMRGVPVKVITRKTTQNLFKGATIITSDNEFVGMGNVDLVEPMKIRSPFLVCRVAIKPVKDMRKTI